MLGTQWEQNGEAAHPCGASAPAEGDRHGEQTPERRATLTPDGRGGPGGRATFRKRSEEVVELVTRTTRRDKPYVFGHRDRTRPVPSRTATPLWPEGRALARGQQRS